jgi:hypothetical protein
MTAIRFSAWAAVLACSAGCASFNSLSQADEIEVKRDLSGRDADKFLALSFYVTPFFGDATKKLLTPVPPDEVRLLDDTSGHPILPGPVEKVLPAGTRVHVTQLEQPTSWAVAGRIVYTPRTRPWLYLAVEGEPKELPFILVLRPQIKSRDEMGAEVERYLAREDPARRMATWSDAVKEAARTKNAVKDMSAEALEMAWGYPELKQISFEGTLKKEKWTYPGEKRVAELIDGRVSQLEDRK